MITRSGSNFQVWSASNMKTTGIDNASNAFTSCRRRTRTKKSSASQFKGISIEKDLSSKSLTDKYDLTDLKWTNNISECPVYYPTDEEFEDPLIYLLKISPEASKYGICKIVLPLKASVPAAEVIRDFKFPTYVQPLRLAAWDRKDKVSFSVGERKHTYNSFKRMADQRFVRLFPNCKHLPPDHLEKEFWHQMSIGKEETVEYAVNVDGTAFSSDPSDQLGASKWNLKTLPKLPDSILRLVEHEIPGITYPMLYIGMIYSMFAWHVEDHYLYSINYHHIGAPKTWYGVPGHAALQFEKVVLDHVYSHEILSTSDVDGASKEIAEKTTMFPPSILLRDGVPVYKAVQMAGEYIITFPRAYHAGFSNGFNCGEAVNFAVIDWFPFGAVASNRYALLRKMAILPYEELLCKETACLPKHEGLDRLSVVEFTSQRALMISFVRHMRGFNHALWGLKNKMKNFRASANQLPVSGRTVICSICKRDCYLSFLECSCCHHLLCLFHGVESLDCQCGGSYIIFVRGDIWDTEDKALKLEELGLLKESRPRYGDLFGHQSDIISGIKSQCIPYTKDDEAAAAAIKMKRKGIGDFGFAKPNNRGYLVMEESLPYSGSTSKKVRRSCKVQRTPTKLGLGASKSQVFSRA